MVMVEKGKERKIVNMHTYMVYTYIRMYSYSQKYFAYTFLRKILEFCPHKVETIRRVLRANGHVARKSLLFLRSTGRSDYRLLNFIKPNLSTFGELQV